MRVVLDANVLVSAAIRTGPSHRVVQAWLQGGTFELIICPELLAEVREVLTERPRLRRWIDLEAAQSFIEAIAITADLVADPAPTSAITRDADDDYLVALARERQADYVVTGDKDLLEWDEQRPPVVSPAEFEELLAR